ncbi:MAG: hypothetical protein AB7V56_11485 [Candidatus Nitrosocosmicus sp.]
MNKNGIDLFADCDITQRRISVQNSILFNGIDYVELNPWQSATSPSSPSFSSAPSFSEKNKEKDKDTFKHPLLFIHCFDAVDEKIDESNVVIAGGTRVQTIQIRWAGRADKIENLLDNFVTENQIQTVKDYIENLDWKENVVVIQLQNLGDRSNYVLKLVQSVKDPNLIPFEGFDNLLSTFEFSFEILCAGNMQFDCYDSSHCDHYNDNSCSCSTKNSCCLDNDQGNFIAPENYMAKDYSSFLELLYNRIAQNNPGRKKKNAADIESMLLELVAYLGDHLSYYQDTVSTESYLGTARNRVSLKRHARLFDYYVDEGCNSRVWVHMKVNRDLILPKKTVLFTNPSQNNAKNSVEYSIDEFDRIKNEVEVFETMYQTTLYRSHNIFEFYTFGDPKCVLPKGSIRAFIKAQNVNFLFSKSVDLDRIADDGESDTKQNLLLFLKSLGISWLDGAVIEKKNIRVLKDPDSEENEDDLEFGMVVIRVFEVSNPAHYLTISFFSEVETQADVEDILKSQARLKFGIPDKNPRQDIAYMKLGDATVLDLKVRVQGSVLSLGKPTLKVGDFLCFEETTDPFTLDERDADPNHRHIIRISELFFKTDPLNGVEYFEIYFKDDPLPFPLCLWNVESEKTNQVSKVLGNIVLADNGYTIDKPEPLDMEYKGRSNKFRPVLYNLRNKNLTYSAPSIFDQNKMGDITSDINNDNGDDDAVLYSLKENDVYSNLGRLDEQGRICPASYFALDSDSKEAMADIFLIKIKDNEILDKQRWQNPTIFRNEGLLNSLERWYPVPDLFNSNEFSKEFVVEREKDGLLRLRFFDDVFEDYKNTKYQIDNDDVCGSDSLNDTNKYVGKDNIHTKEVDKYGDKFQDLYAIYRIGNGSSGNVGPKTIRCYRLEDRSIDLYSEVGNGANNDRFIFDNPVVYMFLNKGDIAELYNPLPAAGGKDPEDMSSIREYVPWAFRKQRRAVIREDYEDLLVEGIVEIQKAVVDIRWTGSWYTVYVLVDMVQGATFNESIKNKIKQYLEVLRLTGYDIEVLEPSYVPLNLEISLCVKENYNKKAIKTKILEELSNKVLKNCERGLFHKDEWTFGQPVFLSHIYERIYDIEGISSLEVVGFRRMNEPQKDQIELGYILMDRQEIAILENDPSFPEKGMIAINFEDGKENSNKKSVTKQPFLKRPIKIMSVYRKRGIQVLKSSRGR